MTLINRRKFLERSKQIGLGMAAGMTILSDARSVRAAPANEKISWTLERDGYGTI